MEPIISRNGHPQGYGFKQLLFSPVASALVVQAESAEKNWRPERLYSRRVDSDKYNLIGQPGDLVSQEYPFLHPSQPLVAYNCLKHHFFADAQGEERHAGDWDSVIVFNLQSGIETQHINRDTLTLPNGIINAWITGIVAFNDIGLFVQAGLSETSSRVDYVVAELDLSQRFLKPLVALPATFM